MRRINLFSLFLVLVLLTGLTVSCLAVSVKVENAVNNYFGNLPKDNGMIAQDKFIEKVKAGEDLFILDIRQPDVYNEGHIKGAVNVPWGKDFANCLDKLPIDQPVYVYCYTAQTANQTVALLNFAGFEAKSVRFGWNLGISKVEGYEAAVETTSNEFEGTTPYQINPELKSAIDAYYQGLADVDNTMFKNYKISEEMLKMLIDAEQDIIILSIRQSSAYAEGHIPGALNIPWGQGMQEYFGQLPEGKIVVYCYTGQTAAQVTAGLRMLGYDAVSLNGGMGTPANNPYGWSNRGYEVVK